MTSALAGIKSGRRLHESPSLQNAQRWASRVWHILCAMQNASFFQIHLQFLLRVGVLLMATKKRAVLATRGGLICAALGSLIGGCGFLLISAVKGNFGLAALSLIPMAVIFAAITAVPFGFMMGFLGVWWLASRAQHILGRRLYLEAIAGGAVLGAAYPLVLTVLGWGPFGNLLSVLPISIAAGIICGIVLTREVQKFTLTVSS